jgi:hypothetical protein
MQRAINTTIEEEVFSTWFLYIYYLETDMFSVSPSRGYVCGTEPNQASRRTRMRMRMKRVLRDQVGRDWLMIDFSSCN